MTEPFTHGQEVMVLDRHGNNEFRGKVMGVHRSNPWQYDVQPEGSNRLAARKPGIPHHQLRPVGREVRAYEQRDEQPKHIWDEA